MEFLAEVGHELCTHKFLSDLFIGRPNCITLPLFIDYNLPMLWLTIKFILWYTFYFLIKWVLATYILSYDWIDFGQILLKHK